MLIAGVNLGSTIYNKTLKDGACCLLVDGKPIVAVAEERLTRNKHHGGFTMSLKYCLETINATIKDVDLLVVSSCCEAERLLESIPELRETDPKKFHFIKSHHLSHAYSSFFASPFENTLIVVLDGGGTVLNNSTPDWWTSPREQASYYIGKGDEISLLHRDFDAPFEVGLGELYRYATKFLGWQTINAGKVMALAAFGDKDRFLNANIFSFDSDTGKIYSQFQNVPLNPVQTFIHFGEKLGVSWGRPRSEGEQITQQHMDIARWVQDQVAEALLWKIRWLSESTGIRNLCLAGGVALNCVINGRILTETPIEHIFIQPASGDDGQSIGNAYAGYKIKHGTRVQEYFFSPYLGKEYNVDDEFKKSKIISSEQKKINIKVKQVDDTDLLLKIVVEKIINGHITAWYQGRSEVGPRALGNRSIIADPRDPTIRDRLNTIKEREFFMPVAPSILADRAGWLLENEGISSPYMLLASPTKSKVAPIVPAVVHYDGTARVQTVNRETNPLFYDLIKTFEVKTGIPLIANTSFNRRGEPIVESVDDAIKSFITMGLDTLVIGNWIIEK